MSSRISPAPGPADVPRRPDPLEPGRRPARPPPPAPSLCVAAGVASVAGRPAPLPGGATARRTAPGSSAGVPGSQSVCSATCGQVPFGHTDGSYAGRPRSSLMPGLVRAEPADAIGGVEDVGRRAAALGRDAGLAGLRVVPGGEVAARPAEDVVEREVQQVPDLVELVQRRRPGSRRS